MEFQGLLLDKLKGYGVGRRKLDDKLFADDIPPARLGIHDLDDERLCHEVIKSVCHIPGCKFATEFLLEFENHYNVAHRYTCSQCKKVLPSPHLLDLHIQEKHDSFFAVMAAKKPSFCCYIEECNVKFLTTDERLDHCVKIHKLPKDFRFDTKPNQKPNKSKVKKKLQHESSMEIDHKVDNKNATFKFWNNKQKAFSNYTGKVFTTDKKETLPQDINMDGIVEELKESLPKINTNSN